MLPINQIINIDCEIGMRMLPDGCIPLTVTSPPYDDLRAYGGHPFRFEPIAEELYRITMEGGVVVWVVQEQIVAGSETGTSSRQRLYFRELGFNLYNTLIINRLGCRYPGLVRYGSSPEYAFVLSKGRPRSINIFRDKPNSTAGRVVRGSRRFRDGRLDNYVRPDKRIRQFGPRGLVWTCGGRTSADRFANEHPALMGEQLARDLILSWSRWGDVVFDPFGGGGTTPKMALLNGRRFIAMEIVPRYCEIARRRIAQARGQRRLRLASR